MDCSTDLQTTVRFLWEAQAQARIEHDYICKVYEVGEVKTQPYIAMQYIDGISLKELNKYLTLEEKVEILKNVATALQTAHSLGIIHRDIKPSNIMVERRQEGNWHPYIMDFGLARNLEAQDHTHSSVVMGTPCHMAPKQVADIFGQTSQIDRRTDIYGLGMTCYEILSGQLPYSNDSITQILLKVRQIEVTPLRKLDHSIPIDLETIVMKCLEKEPAQRYESAKAMAEDLQRYLDGEPIKATTTS
jgi:serine/threonine-protein kinase